MTQKPRTLIEVAMETMEVTRRAANLPCNVLNICKPHSVASLYLLINRCLYSRAWSRKTCPRIRYRGTFCISVFKTERRRGTEFLANPSHAQAPPGHLCYYSNHKGRKITSFLKILPDAWMTSSLQRYFSFHQL